MASNTQNVEIPLSYICPISQTIMGDPYIDTDGNSYEKSAIMDWLRVKKESPITRNPLQPYQLVPNRGLKDMIEKFKRDHPQAVEAYNNGDGSAGTQNTVSTTTTTQVTTSNQLNRKPLVLVAVIDNSGSMQLSCGEAKGTESDGYSRLDLVKHTLCTIITSMTPQDQMSIIKFSTVATAFQPLTYMTSQNQKALMEKLKNLHPENQTNIWDGMRVSINLISELTPEQYTNKNIQIYLLTDGEPNIEPPGPMSDTTMNYIKKKCPHIKPVINTFGYGNTLDSAMLYSMAEVGNEGIFGFLPDSSMVGTVFINALSNSLLVGSPNDADQKALASNSVISKVSTDFVTMLKRLLAPITTAQRCQLLEEFGALIGNALSALVPSSPSYTLEKEFLDGVLLDCTPNMDPKLGQIHKALQEQYFQKWGCHYLRSVLTAYERKICINFKDRGMQSFRTKRFIEEQARIGDIFIQLPPPTPSIAAAQDHQLGYSGGYYGGAMNAPAPSGATANLPNANVFQAAKAGAIPTRFGTGAAGVPTRSAASGYGAPNPSTSGFGNSNAPNGGGFMSFAPGVSSRRAVRSMASYLDAEGGCFTGDSLVLGESPLAVIKVSDLRKGMVVMSNRGLTKIEVVVKLGYTGRMYSIHNTMTLTPYHPVMMQEGKSFFPKDLYEQRCDYPAMNVQLVPHFEDYVYDVVLENRGILACPSVDGGLWYVATYGHNVSVDVFQHSYFGDESIVRDLKAHPGWQDGIIVIDEPRYVRDAETCNVNRLEFYHMEVGSRA